MTDCGDRKLGVSHPTPVVVVVTLDIRFVTTVFDLELAEQFNDRVCRHRMSISSCVQLRLMMM